jgi:hypothetical protein
MTIDVSNVSWPRVRFLGSFQNERAPNRIVPVEGLYAEWRRWTGIEPASRGSLVTTALKAAEPTRYPDTSA